jgi:hypothetical protein
MMTKIVKPSEKWQPREMRLVSEYIAKYYPNSTSLTRVRLGPTHPALLSEEMSEEERRMVTVWRRWADAIIITRTRLILLEASILPDPGDVSKLLLYEYLVRRTPELQLYLDRDIQKVLLVAIEDPVLTTIARAAGIEVVLFCPSWVKEYIQTLAQRKQRAPLTHLGEESKK